MIWFQKVGATTTYQIVAIQTKMGFTPKNTIAIKLTDGSTMYEEQKLGDVLEFRGEMYENAISQTLTFIKISVYQFLQ